MRPMVAKAIKVIAQGYYIPILPIGLILKGDEDETMVNRFL
jgi:hypothetical protein